MKRVKKIMKRVALVIVLLLAFLVSFALKALNTLGLDSAVGFAMQPKSRETLITMDQVDKEVISVSYITKEGKVEQRPIKYYRPKDATGNIPLVYVPHYALDEGSVEWQTYLSNGWAVASPDEFTSAYNEVLVSDDLVFNNAALYTLRNKEGIDKERIALVGGSAGGYMTLMLDGLQLGNVAAIANSPVSNVYFNFEKHFLAANEINKNWKLFDLPIPYVAMSVPRFTKNNDYIESLDDFDKWTELSPLGLAKMFSSPIVITHYTSDMLVPVDTTSKTYTYDKHDGTLPDDFSTRLPDNYPGILSHSLEEELPAGSVSTVKYNFSDLPSEFDLPYRTDSQFSINIIDDGKVSAKNSHNQTDTEEVKTILYGYYLTSMFEKGLGQTEVLSTEKALLLLERYQGKSPQLSAHENVDNTVYGSLVIYQEEIIDELKTYVSTKSLEQLKQEMTEAISQAPQEEQANLQQTWTTIQSQI
ncbi:alpha/beta hydrolase family protein [Streptococcus loxodontisalivarius]|uniref:Pimeloyl-ACP methyl ester carboxylesterase n=1 Tax=Streptococcus loxodontisalivarius TaxID=1349415 RepID=A0ABS2PTI4_9STRE|nr:alpha/beta hydrolase [Streptococcus loxodontisalivarius]MBM7642682.1 pimeloyl-ACP methyl ester carboxylesterase [Streptococcus loxodontisalivarius]